MKFTLRDYQSAAVNHAIQQLQDGTHRTLYTSPTGSGKSVMELVVQSHFDNCAIVTPKIEIAAGMLDKLGLEVPDSESRLYDLADSRQIYTPVRLRNLLLSGAVRPPDYLIIDEAHHDTASTWQDLHLLSACPAVGYTATGFRGTPKGTLKLREQWGEPVPILTYPEAVQLGVISFPECRTVPFVDDDVIEMCNGEFAIASIESVYRTRLRDIAQYSTRFASAGMWDTPTMFSVPSRAIAHELVECLQQAGVPAVAVTGDTPHASRITTFTSCLERTTALVQVQVVSEGVDLAIRRLIDLSPCNSPVKWLQQLGRITRPGGVSHYLCTNRNLMRHGYLLDGLLPPSVVHEAQSAFGGVGTRLGQRAVGLEALGKLKASELPLAGGISGLIYSVTETKGSKSTVYCAILHPCRQDIIWAERRDNGKGDERSYGRWAKCEAPADLKGYSSIPASSVSDKQLQWWKKSAKRHGLDATATPTKKNFQALPVLSDIGIRI